VSVPPASEKPSTDTGTAHTVATGTPPAASTPETATALPGSVPACTTNIKGTWPEVFLAFLRLGLTSFGGPVAHLGYFRQDIAARRRWLDERAFVDLVALCQFLPGPTSSEVGIGIGLTRAGYAGAFAAWAGFTLPSAIALVLFALGVARFGSALGSGWLHGLKIAAVAVVAQAVWGMARTLATGRTRASLAVAAAIIVLFLPTTVGQLGAIALGAAVGLWLLPDDHSHSLAGSALAPAVGRGIAAFCLAVFFVLLLALPLAAAAVPSDSPAGHILAMVTVFYRAGSLVFGGGHVVLPLLQTGVVPPGWLTNDAFLAGYGAAQAVPGPLFTFAAYLGAVISVGPGGLVGAAICLMAIFLPSFLLVIGFVPFWQALRDQPAARAALNGVNAAVVGLLTAALYSPVWRSAIEEPRDFALVLAAFLLLTVWRAPPWLVVMLCAAGGAFYSIG
jgi:chromate transporter